MEGEREISDFIFHLHIIAAFNFFWTQAVEPQSAKSRKWFRKSLLLTDQSKSSFATHKYRLGFFCCFSLRPMYVGLSKPLHGNENTLDAHCVRTDRYLIVLWNQNIKHENLWQKWKKSQNQKSLTVWCKKNIHLPVFSINSRLGNWAYGFGARILPS